RLLPVWGRRAAAERVERRAGRGGQGMWSHPGGHGGLRYPVGVLVGQQVVELLAVDVDVGQDTVESGGQWGSAARVSRNGAVRV
ncbi:hypothetical protein ACFU53_47920, partial [Streptomyces sp. NPDC057474]|uniref:hypothetical protein n=1 Tax=Streptomyces sp. NPDC057474 TaxID=3346144 RepID=UPI0036B2D5D3